MLHFVCATEFDPQGVVSVETINEQTPGESRRRVNRVATLDGGAAFNDFGFADADRTIELRWRSQDRETGDAIDRLVRLYGTVHVSTRAGFFLAAPETYTPGATESRLRLLVKQRLSE